MTFARASRSFLLVAICSIASLAAACGSSGGDTGRADDGGPATTAGDGGTPSLLGIDASSPVSALAFDPPSATLTLDGKTPKTQAFAMKATMADGSTQMVTPDALEFDRPDLATLKTGSPVVLTAQGAYAGVGTLHGIYKGQSATAQLTVMVALTRIGTGVDPGVPAAFGGAPPPDPSLSSLLYPYDKTVFPLGVASPLTMWNGPQANDVYRVHLEEKYYAFDGYYLVAAAAAEVRVDQAIWDRITASNGGEPLALTVSRYDAAAKKAYTSAKETFTIVPASLRGAIYYWTTSNGGHMARIHPGTGAQPEVLNGGKCMGCHAVSADGSTLVAGVEAGGSTAMSPPGPNQATDQGDGRPWESFELPGVTTRVQSQMFAGNVAVNPNGKYTVFGDQRLYLADTKTGQIVTSGLDTLPLDPGMGGFMTPAFSPDGKHLALVEGAGSWYHNLMNGKLLVVDFDEASHTFSNPKALAPASFFPASEHAIAYPTFSPDAAYVAFHVGDYTTGCDTQGCNDAATQIGAIWLESTSGADPVELKTLTDSSPKAADHDVSFEPTFNPVERGGYDWVVFTSSRDWGNRITGTPNNGKKRLWVAAIDKSGGADPSHPAFFLEGQEETTTNMRGFWALAACTPTAGGGACQQGFECCSGFCDMGKCVDRGTIACKGVGETCAMDADCCNAGAVHCVAGSCQAVIPK